MVVDLDPHLPDGHPDKRVLTATGPGAAEFLDKLSERLSLPHWHDGMQLSGKQEAR